MRWDKYFAMLEAVGIRYFFAAGLAFLLFYILLRNTPYFKKIQPRSARYSDYRREVGYSILTMFIFAFVPFVLIEYPPIQKHTTLYREVNTYGTAYFFLVFPLMAIIHDAYFYWMHRVIHHKKLFKYFHLVHHKSTNPSPWAAYAFHPLEAILEVGIFPVFLFTLPVHKLHLALFFLFMIVYNVYIHLGYEIYPKGFHKHWLGKWLNTSVAHNNHHQMYTGNYGLYFTFWDRLMGTLRHDYDQRYIDATVKTKPAAKQQVLVNKAAEKEAHPV